MRVENVTLKLYKERFKFSAAHFLIFDENRAERLHGHNYRVKINIPVPSHLLGKMENGFYIDFSEIKKKVQEILGAWDEKVLFPGNNKDFIFREEEGTLHVNFRNRYYAFPIDEVERLPIINTSVEELSKLIGTMLLQKLSLAGVKNLEVEVEETLGQSATTNISVN